MHFRNTIVYVIKGDTKKISLIIIAMLINSKGGVCVGEKHKFTMQHHEFMPMDKEICIPKPQDSGSISF